MADKKWQKVKNIYNAAFQLEPAERREYLKTVCGSDDDLFREVESLLANSTGSDSFLKKAVNDEIAGLITDENGRRKFSEGQQIGHYKLIKSIGKGGMGEVYLARDTLLDRLVAIKFLSSRLGQETEKPKRFFQEARAASALNHPNIITIHEIGEFENTHFIAAEYIEGETLAEKLAGQTPELKFILDTAIQIASALEAAHHAGIIHRDIKPENIMVRPDGLVKILDFGIAKLSRFGISDFGFGIEEDKTKIQNPKSQISNRHLTSPGAVIGTAGYMSPEQAGGKEVDARTDIFSFGVVLYQMISGRLPFEGENALEMIGSILKDEPKPLHSPFALPPEVEKILGKTLRKDRNERYQVIKDLLIDLRDVKRELEFRDALEKTDRTESKKRSATNLLPESSPGFKRTGANRFFGGPRLIGVAVLLLLAIGFASWYFAGSETARIESIAVMPFVNKSASEDIEYLSDGMTETLINGLSNLPGVSIKSRNSVFRYKGKQIAPRKIAGELNVQAVLLGTVARHGEDTVVLNLELVDAATDNILWSGQYDRKMTDLISLQSEIARNVSQNIRHKLKIEVARKVSKSYTTDSEAYQAYLKGRFYYNKGGLDNFEKSQSFFERAVELDPDYSLAYVGLVDTFVDLTEFGSVAAEDVLPQVRTAARRAVELDPELAESHAALAKVMWFYDWDFAGAEREYRESLRLNPQSAAVHAGYGSLLNKLGRHDEAIAEGQRAVALEPFSSGWNIDLGYYLAMAGRDREAIGYFRKALEISPNNANAHMNLGDSLARLGKYEAALAEYEKMLIRGNSYTKDLSLAFVYALSGNNTKAREYLRREEAKASKNAVGIASIYNLLGEKDKAFEWLERAYRARDPYLLYLKHDWLSQNLRDDARYTDLLKRIGLPE